jgi:membrane protein implicated in regulation of membrane protease activity
MSTEGRMLAVYIASALFGGCVLVGSWLFGHDPGTTGDADTGDDGHAELAHADHHAGPLATLLRLRFWTFGFTFFGLAGLLLHTLGGGLVRAIAPALAVVLGGGAGLAATRIFNRLLTASPGVLGGAETQVGREGRLLLPAGNGQRGKVRLDLPSGASLDFLAESSGDEELPIGTKVMVLELRDRVALVARSLTEKGK